MKCYRKILNFYFRKAREFRAEIDLMQRIGFHERLVHFSEYYFPVNMLACDTISDPILLICAYCANGDLLDFLRKKKGFQFFLFFKIIGEIHAWKSWRDRCRKSNHSWEATNIRDTDRLWIGTLHTILSFKKMMISGISLITRFRPQRHRGEKYYARFTRKLQNWWFRSGPRARRWQWKLSGSGKSIHPTIKKWCFRAENCPWNGCLLKQLQIIHFQPHLMCKGDFLSYFLRTVHQFRWSLGVLFYEIVTLGATPYAGWIVAEVSILVFLSVNWLISASDSTEARREDGTTR